MLLAPLLVLFLLTGTTPASAHAALRTTDPEDGTVLKSAPTHLTLTFTESVGLLDDSFRVLDPDNRRLRTGEPEHAPDGSDTARVTLPAKLGEGTYTVAWRVVSEDSHPVSGAFTFSVGKPSATTATAPTGPVEDPATAGLYNIARYLAYLGAVLLIGTAVFVAVCRREEPGAALRKLLRGGWWALLAATLALLVLRAPYEAGTGPATAFDAQALTRTLSSRPGVVLLARLALLLAVAVCFVLVRSPRRRTLLGAPLALGLALTWAAGEHASAGIQVPLAMTSSVLHLLATAVWLGGLVALLTALHRDRLTPAAVTRFSRLAFASVTVLVVTGVYQSWRGLGSWEALTGTAYGRLLTVKLVAVALLLAAAGLSRRWTARLAPAQTAAVTERVPETVGGPPPAQSRPEQPSAPDTHPRTALRRSVLAEVAVGAAVLVITTILTGTLPGRAEAEAAQAAPPAVGTSVTTIPFDVGTPGGTGKVQITLDPGRVGDNSVEALVYGPDGGISSVPELRLSFTLPAQRIGPLDAELTDRGGYWGNSFVQLPIAGTWEMKVTVRVSEVDQVSVTRKVLVR
ncbi:copper resistance CopC/CopD family protein [Streptomyces dysideae]|uniref:Protein YobA n=1 Tax=Streptomyces dysideae TaxID=909626 RepID=A0A117S0X1_9ACTN|nr:copper resistance protein CopC [Streptomyces dysideae]KUO19729.1 transporter [Streptomyces dysideae]